MENIFRKVTKFTSVIYLTLSNVKLCNDYNDNNIFNIVQLYLQHISLKCFKVRQQNELHLCLYIVQVNLLCRSMESSLHRYNLFCCHTLKRYLKLLSFGRNGWSFPSGFNCSRVWSIGTNIRLTLSLKILMRDVVLYIVLFISSVTLFKYTISLIWYNLVYWPLYILVCWPLPIPVCWPLCIDHCPFSYVHRESITFNLFSRE